MNGVILKKDCAYFTHNYDVGAILHLGKKKAVVAEQTEAKASQLDQTYTLRQLGFADVIDSWQGNIDECWEMIANASAAADAGSS